MRRALGRAAARGPTSSGLARFLNRMAERIERAERLEAEPPIECVPGSEGTLLRLARETRIVPLQLDDTDASAYLDPDSDPAIAFRVRYDPAVEAWIKPSPAAEVEVTGEFLHGALLSGDLFAGLFLPATGRWAALGGRSTVRGVLNGALVVGGTASLKVQRFSGSTWSDTTVDITVREVIGGFSASSLPAGTVCVCSRLAEGGWCLINAACV